MSNIASQIDLTINAVKTKCEINGQGGEGRGKKKGNKPEEIEMNGQIRKCRKF
jgi:hypothetical protein